jgi:hypothetical protein
MHMLDIVLDSYKEFAVGISYITSQPALLMMHGGALQAQLAGVAAKTPKTEECLGANKLWSP